MKRAKPLKVIETLPELLRALDEVEAKHEKSK